MRKLQAILDFWDMSWEDLKGGDCIVLGSPFYEALYEYFCSAGEMPYGVMKARTGESGCLDHESFGSVA